MLEALQAFPFLHWLESIRNPILTAFMSFITLFGQEVLPVGVICILFWCINKKTGYKFILVFFCSGVFCQTLKMVYRIERPWVLDSAIHPVKSALGSATGYSFPSGHTQASTSLFGSLIFYLKKSYMKLLCLVMFLLVGFSRMYLGVHSLFDVVVAMSVTLLFVVLFFTLLNNIAENEKSDLIISLAMGVICIGVLIYAGYLYYNGYVPYDLIKDGFKTVGSGLGLAIGYYIEHKFIKFDVRCKNIWMQIVKLGVGIGSALGFKALLKLVLGENIYSDAGRYVFLVLYIVALYPMLFNKFYVPKEDNNAK